MTTQKPKTPTGAQAALIAHFNGTPAPEGVRINETTYDACRRNGWIERIDAWPFHRVTDDGQLALNAVRPAQAPTSTVTDTDRVMRLVTAYGAECGRGGALSGRAETLLAAIRQAITAKEA